MITRKCSNLFNTEINCGICGEVIVKYIADLGDTVCLGLKNGELVYVCDDCSYKIAMQRISR